MQNSCLGVKSSLIIGSPFSSVSSSKFFFLFTKLTISNRHLSQNYFSFSQHEDSSDNPPFHLILLYPELAVCHLLIVHYHASVPKNGTLSQITSRMLRLLIFSRNCLNLCLNKCTVINSMKQCFAPLNNFVLILAHYKCLLMD